MTDAARKGGRRGSSDSASARTTAAARGARLPTAGRVRQVVHDALERHAAALGVPAAAVGLTLRIGAHHGMETNDGAVEFFTIGADMHPDDRGRPTNEIFSTAIPTWKDRVDRMVGATVSHAARLHLRRMSFDPDQEGRTAPRKAWDIHPITASLLAHYPRIPRFDGSHRLDGAVGRVVTMGNAPGVDDLTVAYGEGLVRLVEATIGGTRLSMRKHRDLIRIGMRVPGVFPNSVVAGMRGRAPGGIAEALGRDPRSALAPVRTVAVGEGHVLLMFDDRLVPWDRRHRGGESWRLARTPE